MRLIFWIVFSLGGLSLHAQDYLVQKTLLGIEEGLSNRFVYSIVQDDLGFMWFGTKYGLNRYDGYNFRNFTAEEDHLQGNIVSELYKDDQGLIWVGHEKDLSSWKELSSVDILHPDSLQFHSFQDYFGKQAPFEEQAIRLLKQGKEELLIVTRQEQVYRYHSKTGFEQLISLPAPYAAPIKQIIATDAGYWLLVGEQLLFQRAGQSQLDTLKQSGVYRIADIGKSETIVYERMEDFGHFIEIGAQAEGVFSIPRLQDSSSITNFILSAESFQGLQLLLTVRYFQLSDQQGKIITRFRAPYSFLRDYYIDNDHHIWLIFDGGILKLSLKKNRFEQAVRGVSTRYIGPLSDSLILASAFNEQSFTLDRRTGDSLEQFQHDMILDGLAADNQHLWLIYSEAGMEYYNWRSNSSRYYSLHSAIRRIWSMAPSGKRGLWLGSIKGLAYFDRADKSSKPWPAPHPFERLNQSVVYQIVKDGEQFWIASSSGLYRMNAQGELLDCYASHEAASYYIPHSHIHHIHIDAAGLLWLATRGGGLIRLNTEQHSYKQYTKTAGLSHNLLYAILEDSFGQLWISSNYGLMRFDKSAESVQVYLEQDGLLNDEFNLGSSYQQENGRLFFGGIDGVIHFMPQHFLRDTVYSAPLRLIRFEQFDGNQQTVVNRTAELKRSQRISLAAGDAFFILDLALLDYTQPQQHRFAYRIEGLDQDWNYLSSNRLRINRLPAGNYTLRIKASGKNGRWSTQQLAFPLEVQQVFYQRTRFWVLMAIGLLLLLLLYWRWRLFRFQRQQRELESEVAKRTAQIERDKKTIEEQAATLKELDNLKSRFFTNISHELRTPLTLMLGPIGAIQREQYGRDFEKIQQVLAVVKDNGRKLQELVDEILDLSKLEAQGLDLEDQPLALKPFLLDLFQQFEAQTALQGIVFTLHYEAEEDLVLLVDIKKLEKILRNLLSNALKFTPSGAQIQLKAYTGNSGWFLEVEDSGEGIHPQDLPHIFQRFYQSRQKEVRLQGGSGIGLALAYELAKLMGGQLSVKSTWKSGSCFKLRLPLQKSQAPAVPLVAKRHPQLPSKPQNKAVQGHRLLIVEDNAQLRQFLVDLLTPYYRVKAVENGAKAWGLLQQAHSFDLLLSDIMMPEMDGFELLRRVKERGNLPVVLLTARATQSDQIEALSIGVDDYLTKPFEQEELLLRLQRLLQNRQTRLKARQTAPLEAPSAAPSTSEQEAQQWIKKMEKIMREEVSNSDFSMPDLAERMHLSERQFRRRLKELVGLSPNKYFVSVRLQVARELLEQGQCDSLQEIAEQVGYTNAHYFAKIYEKTLGRPVESYFD